MSILDTDAQVKTQAENKVYIEQIKNIEAMKDFQTFANDHLEAFARLHAELFRTEYYTPYSYTGISRYFQIDFPESRNYSHAAFLIREFLLREGLIGRNSEIANMLPEDFAEVVKYVHHIIKNENSQQMMELLLRDKQNYVQKISSICQDLLSRFTYLKTPAIVTAILSLMTGWCPILNKKFVPNITNSNFKTLQEDLLRTLYILAPTIDCIAKVNGMDSMTFAMIWAFIHTMITYYITYSKL